MKKNIPTVAEIKDLVEKDRTLSLTEWSKIADQYEGKEVYIRIDYMTEHLMENAPQHRYEDVWKFAKKLKSYWHCPVSPAEYARMKVYAEDEELVAITLKALNDEEYPFEREKHRNFITYFYAVALISQSSHHREESLKTLERLTRFFVENKPFAYNALLRNMEVLSKKFPDLKPFAEELRANQIVDTDTEEK